MKLEIVLAFQAAEVPIVELNSMLAIAWGKRIVCLGHAYLGQHNDHWTRLRKFESELGVMIIYRPRHIQAGPLLGDRPFGTEEPSARHALIFP
jgi:hypothetical protein